MNNKILICTVSLNSEKTIKKCLSSTYDLCKKNKNISHVIKDGISIDNTIKIIKSFSHVKYQTKSDKGIYDAFNQASEILNDWDYIYYLNSDDYLTKEGAEQLDKISKTEKIYLKEVYFFAIQIKKGIKKIKIFPKKINEFSLLMGYMPPHPGMITSKKLFVPFKTNFKVSADYDFFLKIIQSEEFTYENSKIIINTMGYGGNSQTLQGRLRSSIEDFKIFKQRSNAFFAVIAIFSKKLKAILKYYLI